MIHRLHRSQFLRPRERLYELITLQEAERGGISVQGAAEPLFDRRTIAGYLEETTGSRRQAGAVCTTCWWTT